MCSECNVVNCNDTCHINPGEFPAQSKYTLRNANNTADEKYSSSNNITNVSSNCTNNHDSLENVDQKLSISDNKIAEENQSSFSNDKTDTKQYPSMNACPDELTFQRRGIHIGNLNIRHLKPKLDNVKLMLNSLNQVDIFGLCETFLNKTIDDNTVNIEGYKIERKDRGDCHLIEAENGGGILIYIGLHINYLRRVDLESHDIESVWIEIQIKNCKSFLICSVYLPPSAKVDWFENFSKQIEAATSNCSEIYLMWDFNVDFYNGTLNNTTWKHVIELNDLNQIINQPTRVTAHSEKIINYIYASHSSNVAETFVPCIAVSDHYPVCFTRTVSKNQLKRGIHKTIQYRCYKNFNEEQFLNNLSETLNNIRFEHGNSDSIFSLWVSSFVSVLDEHAPVKTKRVKHDIQPEWLNEDIKDAIKNRNIHHKHKNWDQYKFWRNKSITLIRQAKTDFFSNAIEENRDSSYLWKHVKKLGNQFECSNLPDELIIDGKTIHASDEITNKLNSYFANISDTLKASEQAKECTDFDFQTLRNYTETLIPPNIYFRIPAINISTLISTIKSLDTSKATGLDGLSPKVLKISADIIAPSLLEIINISFQDGHFPDILKIAKTISYAQGRTKT